MGQKRIALFLVERSDFQELLREDAASAARKAGLALETHFTGHEFAAQLTKIREVLSGAAPPVAVLVLPVRDHGLARAAREAVKAGITFVFTNRTEDELEPIRKEAVGGAVISQICADELETGRIQARQFRALLPKGGKILYVQGGARSLSARDRTAGMQEGVAGSGLEVSLVEAGWKAEDAHAAMRHRLGLLGRIHAHVDLIGCHTDQIATGVLRALGEVAAELRQPEIARIPVTGCDGSPALGQKLVDEGRLAASIVLPRVVGPAIERVAASLNGGGSLPPEIHFTASSYPSVERLIPLRSNP
jgi:ABC-type sugar transport system substrate-binding protein